MGAGMRMASVVSMCAQHGAAVSTTATFATTEEAGAGCWRECGWRYDVVSVGAGVSGRCAGHAPATDGAVSTTTTTTRAELEVPTTTTVVVSTTTSKATTECDGL